MYPTSAKYQERGSKQFLIKISNNLDMLFEKNNLKFEYNLIDRRKIIQESIIQLGLDIANLQLAVPTKSPSRKDINDTIKEYLEGKGKATAGEIYAHLKTKDLVININFKSFKETYISRKAVSILIKNDDKTYSIKSEEEKGKNTRKW